jgi:hypothetical protein
VVFFCPRCGQRLLNVAPNGDLLVFGGGGWRTQCLVSFEGQMQGHIKSAVLTPSGLEVVNGLDQVRTMPLLRLLGDLRRGAEELEL